MRARALVAVISHYSISTDVRSPCPPVTMGMPETSKLPQKLLPNTQIAYPIDESDPSRRLNRTLVIGVQFLVVRASSCDLGR
jgi:hypothetical protein